MRRPVLIAAIAGVMEAVLPRHLGEAAVGDLEEEYLIRARTMSRAGSAAWFAGQAVRSLPGLLLVSAKPLSFLLSLGVAGSSYYVLGLIERYMHRAVDVVIEPPTIFWLLMSDLAVGFMACACGGFLSTCLRRGSAAIYSLIGTAFIVSAMRNMNPDLPTWFPIAFLVVAFVAPITGGAAFVSLARRLAGRPRPRGGQGS